MLKLHAVHGLLLAIVAASADVTRLVRDLEPPAVSGGRALCTVVDFAVQGLEEWDYQWWEWTGSRAVFNSDVNGKL